MDAFTAFLVAFLTTVALLFVAFGTGLRGLRAAHLVAVGATVLGLVLSVVFAIAVGRELVFDATVERIHKVFANAVVLLLVPMVVTGVGILLGKAVRGIHRRVAIAVLVVAIIATFTGFWMKSTGTPRAEVSMALGLGVTVLSLAAALAAALWAVVLPGTLLAHLALPGADPLERLIAGLALGAGVMPVACFGVAMALGTIPSPLLVLSLAAAANAVLGALAWRRRGSLP